VHLPSEARRSPAGRDAFGDQDERSEFLVPEGTSRQDTRLPIPLLYPLPRRIGNYRVRERASQLPPNLSRKAIRSHPGTPAHGLVRSARRERPRQVRVDATSRESCPDDALASKRGPRKRGGSTVGWFRTRSSSRLTSCAGGLTGEFPSRLKSKANCSTCSVWRLIDLPFCCDLCPGFLQGRGDRLPRGMAAGASSTGELPSRVRNNAEDSVQ
jgi:hypothetical protein